MNAAARDFSQDYGRLAADCAAHLVQTGRVAIEDRDDHLLIVWRLRPGATTRTTYKIHVRTLEPIRQIAYRNATGSVWAGEIEPDGRLVTS